jgi:endonuclease G
VVPQAEAKVVTVEDLISAPEKYVDQRIVVRGRAAITPGMCDTIKIGCELSEPTIKNCSGQVALSPEAHREVEVSGLQSAILLDVRDPRFHCRGACESWTCEGAVVGRIYEATGRWGKFRSDNRPVAYQLVPESLRMVEDNSSRLPSGPLASSPHIVLGVPVDEDPSNDVLLDEKEFAVSYNPQKLNPNWAAWRLDPSYLGHARRKDNFRADPSLPVNVYHVTPHDYVRSGYDRGHMCPSADRERTPEMNSLTFLMTNMVPQLHELNAGPWEKLEEHERELAEAPDAEVYILAGPIYGPNPRKVGHGVVVPWATWKIIVPLKKGQTASDVTDSTEVVSVIMPNEKGVGKHQWTEYLTSVDQIERLTRYDFLELVPDRVENVIEARSAVVR